MTRPSEPWTHLQNTVLGEPVYDAVGREVKVGDLIAIGMRSGNQGDLVLGRVTGFSTRKDLVRTFVRRHEPEYEAARHMVKDHNDEWVYVTPTYKAPNFDRAVTVQVTYEDPLGGPVIGTGKGFTTAYNRRFVVVES